MKIKVSQRQPQIRFNRKIWSLESFPYTYGKAKPHLIKYKYFTKISKFAFKTVPSIKYPQNFTELYSFLFNIFLISSERANRKSIHNTHSNYFNKHILFLTLIKEVFFFIYNIQYFNVIFCLFLSVVYRIIFYEIKG